MDVLGGDGFFLALGEVLGNRIVEFLFLGCQLVGNRSGGTLHIEWVALPVFHVLFQTTDEELVQAVLAEFLDAVGSDVGSGEDVFIQQLEQPLECVLTATVECGGQQKDMLAPLRQHKSGLVSSRPIGLQTVFVGRQLVCLIEDDQIPVGVFEHLHVFVATNEVDGSHQTVVSLEDGGVGIEDLAVDQGEGQIELHAHFILLPLLGEATGRDNENALDHLAHEHFLDEQTRHDGLTSASVVGQEETDSRLRQ